MTEFSSLFAARINAFLDYRAAHGYKRETYLLHLMKFDRWCKENYPGDGVLDREIVHAWIDESTKSACGTPQKARALRQFGKYLRAVGEEAYVLPDKYAPSKSRSVPYLFTDAEMTALFKSIDALPPTAAEPYLDEIAPVMFRLIYTCGLRPNEGRELLEENVHLDTGEILVTHTKRNKEQIVVMSDDMLRLAREYSLRRKIFASDSPYFFPSIRGGALKNETVYSEFNRAWSHAGPSAEKVRRVRVYDLRHRFASACLNRWLDNGENLMAMLPFLREYMGHKDLAETAYYIHILPENITKSSAIDWDKFNSMFPEVQE